MNQYSNIAYLLLSKLQISNFNYKLNARYQNFLYSQSSILAVLNLQKILLSLKNLDLFLQLTVKQHGKILFLNNFFEIKEDILSIILKLSLESSYNGDWTPGTYTVFSNKVELGRPVLIRPDLVIALSNKKNYTAFNEIKTRFSIPIFSLLESHLTPYYMDYSLPLLRIGENTSYRSIYLYALFFQKVVLYSKIIYQDLNVDSWYYSFFKPSFYEKNDLKLSTLLLRQRRFFQSFSDLHKINKHVFIAGLKSEVCTRVDFLKSLKVGYNSNLLQKVILKNSNKKIIQFLLFLGFQKRIGNSQFFFEDKNIRLQLFKDLNLFNNLDKYSVRESKITFFFKMFLSKLFFNRLDYFNSSYMLQYEQIQRIFSLYYKYIFALICRKQVFLSDIFIMPEEYAEDLENRGKIIGLLNRVKHNIKIRENESVLDKMNALNHLFVRKRISLHMVRLVLESFFKRVIFFKIKSIQERFFKSLSFHKVRANRNLYENCLIYNYKICQLKNLTRKSKKLIFKVVNSSFIYNKISNNFKIIKETPVQKVTFFSRDGALLNNVFGLNFLKLNLLKKKFNFKRLIRYRLLFFKRRVYFKNLIFYSKLKSFSLRKFRLHFFLQKKGLFNLYYLKGNFLSRFIQTKIKEGNKKQLIRLKTNFLFNNKDFFINSEKKNDFKFENISKFNSLFLQNFLFLFLLKQNVKKISKMFLSHLEKKPNLVSNSNIFLRKNNLIFLNYYLKLNFIPSYFEQRLFLLSSKKFNSRKFYVINYLLNLITSWKRITKKYRSYFFESKITSRLIFSLNKDSFQIGLRKYYFLYSKLFLLKQLRNIKLELRFFFLKYKRDINLFSIRDYNFGLINKFITKVILKKNFITPLFFFFSRRNKINYLIERRKTKYFKKKYSLSSIYKKYSFRRLLNYVKIRSNTLLKIRYNSEKISTFQYFLLKKGVYYLYLQTLTYFFDLKNFLKLFFSSNNLNKIFASNSRIFLLIKFFRFKYNHLFLNLNRINFKKFLMRFKFYFLPVQFRKIFKLFFSKFLLKNSSLFFFKRILHLLDNQKLRKLVFFNKYVSSNFLKSTFLTNILINSQLKNKNIILKNYWVENKKQEKKQYLQISSLMYLRNTLKGKNLKLTFFGKVILLNRFKNSVVSRKLFTRLNRIPHQYFFKRFFTSKSLYRRRQWRFQRAVSVFKKIINFRYKINYFSLWISNIFFKRLVIYNLLSYLTKRKKKRKVIFFSKSFLKKFYFLFISINHQFYRRVTVKKYKSNILKMSLVPQKFLQLSCNFVRLKSKFKNRRYLGAFISRLFFNFKVKYFFFFSGKLLKSSVLSYNQRIKYSRSYLGSFYKINFLFLLNRGKIFRSFNKFFYLKYKCLRFLHQKRLIQDLVYLKKNYSFSKAFFLKKSSFHFIKYFYFLRMLWVKRKVLNLYLKFVLVVNFQRVYRSNIKQVQYCGRTLFLIGKKFRGKKYTLNLLNTQINNFGIKYYYIKKVLKQFTFNRLMVLKLLDKVKHKKNTYFNINCNFRKNKFTTFNYLTRLNLKILRFNTYGKSLYKFKYHPGLNSVKFVKNVKKNTAGFSLIKLDDLVAFSGIQKDLLKKNLKFRLLLKKVKNNKLKIKTLPFLKQKKLKFKLISFFQIRTLSLFKKVRVKRYAGLNLTRFLYQNNLFLNFFKKFKITCSEFVFQKRKNKVIHLFLKKKKTIVKINKLRTAFIYRSLFIFIFGNEKGFNFKSRSLNYFSYFMYVLFIKRFWLKKKYFNFFYSRFKKLTKLKSFFRLFGFIFKFILQEKMLFTKFFDHLKFAKFNTNLLASRRSFSNISVKLKKVNLKKKNTGKSSLFVNKKYVPLHKISTKKRIIANNTKNMVKLVLSKPKFSLRNKKPIKKFFQFNRKFKYKNKGEKSFIFNSFHRTHFNIKKNLRTGLNLYTPTRYFFKSFFFRELLGFRVIFRSYRKLLIKNSASFFYLPAFNSIRRDRVRSRYRFYSYLRQNNTIFPDLGLYTHQSLVLNRLVNKRMSRLKYSVLFYSLIYKNTFLNVLKKFDNRNFRSNLFLSMLKNKINRVDLKSVKKSSLFLKAKRINFNLYSSIKDLKISSEVFDFSWSNHFLNESLQRYNKYFLPKNYLSQFVLYDHKSSYSGITIQNKRTYSVFKNIAQKFIFLNSLSFNYDKFFYIYLIRNFFFSRFFFKKKKDFYFLLLNFYKKFQEYSAFGSFFSFYLKIKLKRKIFVNIYGKNHFFSSLLKKYFFYKKYYIYSNVLLKKKQLNFLTLILLFWKKQFKFNLLKSFFLKKYFFKNKRKFILHNYLVKFLFIIKYNFSNILINNKISSELSKLKYQLYLRYFFRNKYRSLLKKYLSVYSFLPHIFRAFKRFRFMSLKVLHGNLNIGRFVIISKLRKVVSQLIYLKFTKQKRIKNNFAFFYLKNSKKFYLKFRWLINSNLKYKFLLNRKMLVIKVNSSSLFGSQKVLRKYLIFQSTRNFLKKNYKFRKFFLLSRLRNRFKFFNLKGISKKVWFKQLRQRSLYNLKKRKYLKLLINFLNFKFFNYSDKFNIYKQGLFRIIFDYNVYPLGSLKNLKFNRAFRHFEASKDPYRERDANRLYFKNKAKYEMGLKKYETDINLRFYNFTILKKVRFMDYRLMKKKSSKMSFITLNEVLVEKLKKKPLVFTYSWFLNKFPKVGKYNKFFKLIYFFNLKLNRYCLKSQFYYYYLKLNFFSILKKNFLKFFIKNFSISLKKQLFVNYFIFSQKYLGGVKIFGKKRNWKKVFDKILNRTGRYLSMKKKLQKRKYHYKYRNYVHNFQDQGGYLIIVKKFLRNYLKKRKDLYTYLFMQLKIKNFYNNILLKQGSFVSRRLNRFLLFLRFINNSQKKIKTVFKMLLYTRRFSSFVYRKPLFSILQLAVNFKNSEFNSFSFGSSNLYKNRLKFRKKFVLKIKKKVIILKQKLLTQFFMLNKSIFLPVKKKNLNNIIFVNRLYYNNLFLENFSLFFNKQFRYKKQLSLHSSYLFLIRVGFYLISLYNVNLKDLLLKQLKLVVKNLKKIIVLKNFYFNSGFKKNISNFISINKRFVSLLDFRVRYRTFFLRTFYRFQNFKSNYYLYKNILFKKQRVIFTQKSYNRRKRLSLRYLRRGMFFYTKFIHKITKKQSKDVSNTSLKYLLTLNGIKKFKNLGSKKFFTFFQKKIQVQAKNKEFLLQNYSKRFSLVADFEFDFNKRNLVKPVEKFRGFVLDDFKSFFHCGVSKTHRSSKYQLHLRYLLFKKLSYLKFFFNSGLLNRYKMLKRKKLIVSIQSSLYFFLIRSLSCSNYFGVDSDIKKYSITSLYYRKRLNLLKNFEIIDKCFLKTKNILKQGFFLLYSQEHLKPFYLNCMKNMKFMPNFIKKKFANLVQSSLYRQRKFWKRFTHYSNLTTDILFAVQPYIKSYYLHSYFCFVRQPLSFFVDTLERGPRKDLERAYNFSALTLSNNRQSLIKTTMKSFSSSNILLRQVSTHYFFLVMFIQKIILKIIEFLPFFGTHIFGYNFDFLTTSRIFLPKSINFLKYKRLLKKRNIRYNIFQYFQVISLWLIFLSLKNNLNSLGLFNLFNEYYKKTYKKAIKDNFSVYMFILLIYRFLLL